MKILDRSIALNQPGQVKLVPEDPDDLWLLYNFIATGDTVSADTTRKIHNFTDSGSKKNPSRVRVDLEINITAVDYDKDSSVLRVRGKTLMANELVSAGTFHTLELEINKEFRLKKHIWDDQSIKALTEGCNRTAGADLAAVLISGSSAQIFLVGKTTTLCATIQGSGTNKNKFLEGIHSAFMKHVDFNNVKCVVIGSSGGEKDEFLQYLLSKKTKSIENNKSRLVAVKTKGGNKGDLSEAMMDEKVMNLIKDAKVGMEVKALKKLTDMISGNSDRVCYGPKSVEAANELTAIETLMITEDLFKSPEVEARQRYTGLVKSVEKAGGKALVVSSMHVSGEQLAMIAGIAAILRFPLPHLDDVEDL